MFDDLFDLGEPVLTDARLDRVLVDPEAGTYQSSLAAVFVDQILPVIRQSGSDSVDNEHRTM